MQNCHSPPPTTLSPAGEIPSDWKSPEGGTVTADLVFEQDGTIFLTFRWPSQWKMVVSPRSRQELWKSTCFEAFIKAQDGEGYHEINLSPPGQWNAYRFDRYREPLPPREVSGWRLLDMNTSAGELSARMQTDLPPGREFQVGLSCVMEIPSGEKVYWSLGEGGGTHPDFHDARCFLLKRSSV